MNDPTIKIPCTGEAHNPKVGGMIDNCGVCTPEWAEITVCADCKHTPRQHASDGCHAPVQERGEIGRGKRPERCACARKFWRQGGTARLKTVAVEVSIKMYHGRTPEPTTFRTVTYKAINSSDALYQSRTDLYDEFLRHVEGCGAEEECFMNVSHNTRGTSTGFAIGRDDLKAA